MRQILVAASILFAVSTSTGCVIEGDGDSSLSILNDSSYVIEEIHVAAQDSASWGPNLIPAALFPGEEFSVVVDCDVYDVQIVDEDDFVCEVYGVELCFDDNGWVIDDAFLNTCGF